MELLEERWTVVKVYWRKFSPLSYGKLPVPCTVRKEPALSGVPIELFTPLEATHVNHPSCELRTESTISITDTLTSNSEALVRTTKSEMTMVMELASGVSESLKNHWIEGAGMPSAWHVKLAESDWLMVVLSGNALTSGGSVADNKEIE